MRGSKPSSAAAACEATPSARSGGGCGGGCDDGPEPGVKIMDEDRGGGALGDPIEAALPLVSEGMSLAEKDGLMRGDAEVADCGSRGKVCWFQDGSGL
jgi:hypothetical protein